MDKCAGGRYNIIPGEPEDHVMGQNVNFKRRCLVVVTVALQMNLIHRCRGLSCGVRGEREDAFFS